MTVLYHPEFSADIRRLKAQYSEISKGLGARFEKDVLQAIDAIKSSPARDGHFLFTEASTVYGLRRKNLRSFPFFVLYGF